MPADPTAFGPRFDAIVHCPPVCMARFARPGGCAYGSRTASGPPYPPPGRGMPASPPAALLASGSLIIPSIAPPTLLAISATRPIPDVSWADDRRGSANIGLPMPSILDDDEWWRPGDVPDPGAPPMGAPYPPPPNDVALPAFGPYPADDEELAPRPAMPPPWSWPDMAGPPADPAPEAASPESL